VSGKTHQKKGKKKSVYVCTRGEREKEVKNQQSNARDEKIKEHTKEREREREIDRERACACMCMKKVASNNEV